MAWLTALTSQMSQSFVSRLRTVFTRRLLLFPQLFARAITGGWRPNWPKGQLLWLRFMLPVQSKPAVAGAEKHRRGPFAGPFAVALPDTRGRNCYLTDGDGDPPRSYTPEHATSYPTRLAAAGAIIEARKLTPFRPRVMVVVPHPAS